MKPGYSRLEELCGDLPESDAEAVRRAVHDGRIPAEDVAITLSLNGLNISASTIRTIRRKARKEQHELVN